MPRSCGQVETEGLRIGHPSTLNARVDAVVHGQAMKEKLQGALAKLANREVAAAWNQWVQLVEYKRATKEKLQGALARMANRDLAAAWNQWQENAQLQQATRRAVRRWVQACLAGAFLGWVDAVSSAATMRDKLGRALAKLAQRGSAGG